MITNAASLRRPTHNRRTPWTGQRNAFAVTAEFAEGDRQDLAEITDTMSRIAGFPVQVEIGRVHPVIG